MNKQADKQKATEEYKKAVKLQVAYDIIGSLDDNALGTEWIDKAIAMLENLKHVRKNLPF